MNKFNEFLSGGAPDHKGPQVPCGGVWGLAGLLSAPGHRSNSLWPSALLMELTAVTAGRSWVNTDVGVLGDLGTKSPPKAPSRTSSLSFRSVGLFRCSCCVIFKPSEALGISPDATLQEAALKLCRQTCFGFFFVYLKHQQSHVCQLWSPLRGESRGPVTGLPTRDFL